MGEDGRVGGGQVQYVLSVIRGIEYVQIPVLFGFGAGMLVNLPPRKLKKVHVITE